MKRLPWCLRRPVPPGLQPWKRLADAWDLPPLAARLAWLRGLDQPEELAWRLDPVWERVLDPYLMEGTGKAVARIQKAIEGKETICVYGDYDVDGVTATALLVRTLEKLGAKVGFFIPNRFSDGYGLHGGCIQELAATRGPALMISVDCGIRSLEEVEASRPLGLDWIITDHHQLGETSPRAAAVLHPRLGTYPNGNLAGVGVAFKLAQALLDAVPVPKGGDAAFLDGLLKLVAIGTIADMVPLEGENATLTKRGLQSLGKANGPGLSALLKAARIEGEPTAQQLAFGLIPRLNAVGRMGGAEDAVRLLLTRDAQEAALLAERVETLNSQRREVQQALLERLSAPDGAAFDLVLDPEAHKGVIGIVAGRRMQESGLPTAVCTLLEGTVNCSLRAPEGYDLGALLDLARPFLNSGGGHKAAAGMSFELSRLTFVREVLIRGAKLQASNLAPPSLSLDGAGPEWMPSGEDLTRLEPFGQGFPDPLLRMAGVLQRPPSPFGNGHCKLRVVGLHEDLVWFSAEDPVRALKTGDPIDLAVSPQDSARWGRSWLVKAQLDGEVG